MIDEYDLQRRYVHKQLGQEEGQRNKEVDVADGGTNAIARLEAVSLRSSRVQSTNRVLYQTASSRPHSPIVL